MSVTSSDSPAAPPGVRRIGPYVLDELLARTGMSEVHGAHAADGTRVVIKRLGASGPENPEAPLRFRREASLLALLTHPHVVRVLDVGDAEGRPYLCLERVEGATLMDLVRATAPPIETRLELLRQIASGLAHIHEKGVIHGDVKPDNVLVSTTGPTPIAKISDFGLAGDAAWFKEGVSGTPHYIAPEQTRLVDWPIDPRSDLYSLGVLAYEVLTGRLPFEGDELASLLRQHVYGAPVPPGQHAAGLPPIVERVVLKLLAKAPADRYRSAASLATDLETILGALRRGDAAPFFALDTLDDVGSRVGVVFSGRDEELAELELALRRVRQGRPGLVLVEGDPGVGKSALLREFRNRSLTTGASFASGKCHEFSRGLPFFGLAEAIDEHVRSLAALPAAERDAVLGKIRDVAGDLARDLARVMPALAPHLDVGSERVSFGEERDRTRFLDVLTRLLECLAPADRPLVLLLDDLQWSDSGTIRLLEALLDLPRPAPILVLGSVRPKEVAPDQALAKLMGPPRPGSALRRISLGPMDQRGCALVLAESLRQPLAAIPARLVEVLFERTRGNALFLTEAVRASLRLDVVRVAGGRLEVDLVALEALRLPDSVVDFLVGELDRLPETTRLVLGTAAVAGHDVDLELVTSVAEVDEAAAYEALRGGQARQLLALVGLGTYRFQHDRIRDACAKLAPLARRATLHRRLMEHLASRPHTPVVVYALAEHAAQAGAHAEAWTYSTEAGRLCQESHAHDQAVRFFRQALAHADDASIAPAARREVRLRLADVLDLQGAYADATTTLEALAAEGGAAIDRAPVLAKLAYTLQKSGEYGRSRDLLLEALAVLGTGFRPRLPRFAVLASRVRYAWNRLRQRVLGPAARDPRRLLVLDVLTRLFNVLSIVDAKALPYLTYRLLAEAALLGPSRELAVAHGKLAISLPQLRRPRFARAIAHAERSVAIARAEGHPLVAGQSLVYLSASLVWNARYVDALPRLAEARAILSSLGEMWDLANAHIFSFIAHKACGRLDDALAHGRALLELGERIRAQGTIANAHQKIGDVLLSRDDLARGETHVTRSIELALASNLKFDLFQAHKIRGAARLRAGAWAEAAEAYRAAIAVLETPGTSFFQAYVSDTYLGLAEAELRGAPAPGPEAVAAIATRVDACLARERLLQGHLAQAHRVRGLIALGRGQTVEARRELERAMRVLARQARPIDLAATRLDAAELLTGHGLDATTAARWLRQARDVFRAAQMGSRAARCDELLGTAPVRAAPPRTTEDPQVATIVEATRRILGAQDEAQVLEAARTAGLAVTGAARAVLVRPEPKTTPAPPWSALLERARGDGRVAIGGPIRGPSAPRSAKPHEPPPRGQGRDAVVWLDGDGLAAGLVFLDCRAAMDDAALARAIDGIAVQARLGCRAASRLREVRAHARDLDGRVTERTIDLELANGRLDEAVATLRTTTLKLAEARRAALEQDLALARAVHRQLLPEARGVTHQGVHCELQVDETRDAAGAFWFWQVSPAGILAIFGVTEVEGTGGAMLLATLRGAIETLVSPGTVPPPPAELLARLDEVTTAVTGTAAALGVTLELVQIAPTEGIARRTGGVLGRTGGEPAAVTVVPLDRARAIVLGCGLPGDHAPASIRIGYAGSG